MSNSAAVTVAADRWVDLRIAAAPLLLGIALLGLVFRQEVMAAVSVWSTSTAYNHCFLVLPIALWLAYDRRCRLPGVQVRPRPWIALAVLPCAAAWLVAERLGIMEGRQLMAMACIELLFLSVLGWRLAWLLAAPLLYLFFLVPFGSFLTPALQDFTAHFIVSGLDVIGIPNISDGNVIEIPEGVFFVAEACAGLRFLIASVAFGVLYAVTFYRTPGRQIAFVAASIVVPVLANGVRALGIVAAGHWLGSAEAAAADHLIYGWLFFSGVTLVLILCGLPFRQDGKPEPASRTLAPSTRASLPAMALAAVLVGMIAAAGPLLAGGLDRGAALEPVAAMRAVAGCTLRDRDAASRFWGMPATAGNAVQAFACHDGMVELLVVAFPPRTNPTIILALQRALSEQEGAEDTEVTAIAGVPGWKLVTTSRPAHVAATALWLDGAFASGGLRSRMQQARNSLTGAGGVPVLAVIHAAGSESLRQEVAAISNFLRDADAGSLAGAQMAGFSAAPATAH